MSFIGTAPCFGSVALLMEEPYGELGSFDPTGHAAVYLNHICAASPTELRICENGETGVVISRYHKINRDDSILFHLFRTSTRSQMRPRLLLQWKKPGL